MCRAAPCPCRAVPVPRCAKLCHVAMVCQSVMLFSLSLSLSLFWYTLTSANLPKLVMMLREGKGGKNERKKERKIIIRFTNMNLSIRQLLVSQCIHFKNNTYVELLIIFQNSSSNCERDSFRLPLLPTIKLRIQ